MGGAPAARSSLAADPRSVAHPGGRGDAAADRRLARARALRALLRAVPDARGLRGGTGERRHRGLARFGLQPSSAATARRVAAHHRRRGGFPPHPRRPSGTAGRGALHRPSRARPGFRTGRGRRGHQRRTPAGAPRRAAPHRRVPPGKAWLWNQALFDLGATVCSRRAPACEDCPLRGHCGWRGEGPDPADGSAGVGVSQPPFEGSDRQGRGRLVDALRAGPQPVSAAAYLMGLDGDPPRAHRIVASLRRDGLVIEQDSTLQLPDT